jgi:hypothetical protein
MATPAKAEADHYGPKERAARIGSLLHGYSGDKTDPQDPADIAYAIADMMHWADVHGGDEDFESLVNWAREHYEEER